MSAFESMEEPQTGHAERSGWLRLVFGVSDIVSCFLHPHFLGDDVDGMSFFTVWREFRMVVGSCLRVLDFAYFHMSAPNHSLQAEKCLGSLGHDIFGDAVGL